MSAAIRSYLLSVAAAGILLSLVRTLLPKKGARQAATFVGGLLLLLTVLSPLSKLDAETFARSLSRLRLQTESVRTGITVENRALMSAIIKEKAETYILDKAEEMGLVLQAEVTVSDGTAYPCPVKVTLRGNVPESKKAWLSRYISDNLGIPEEQQEWMEM